MVSQPGVKKTVHPGYQREQTRVTDEKSGTGLSKKQTQSELSRATQRRSFRGLTLAGISAVVGVAAVGVAVASTVARVVVTPPKGRVEDIRVEQFWRTKDSMYLKLAGTSDTRLSGTPGIYSFWFDNDRGHAQLGEIVDQSWDTVTRRVLRIDSGDLSQVKRGRINGWVWTKPEDFGYPYEDVLITSPTGQNPAWVFPSETPSDLWVIHIHGRGSKRAETLRGVLPMMSHQANSLVISYRNDGDAAPSQDGKYGLGNTEWLDVEAAVRFAMDRGAKHVVLFGWSMGGAIALQAATRSRLSHVIKGLILDSPVVDWTKALRYQSEAVRLPTPVQNLVLTILSKPWGRHITRAVGPIDLMKLNWLQRSDEIDKPLLIMHSDDDGYVPSGPSRELAAARPDIITYVAFEKARHCKMWNYNQPKWEGAITEWMKVNGVANGYKTPRTRRRKATN